MNKRNKLIIILGLLVLIILLLLVIPKEKVNKRNVITFQESTEEVIDSLRVMRNFVQNLSLHIDKKSGYYIDKGRFYNDLYIGGKKVLNVEDLKNSLLKSKQTKDSVELQIQNDEVFAVLPDDILTRFIYLSVYLDNNYISSSYIDKYYDAVIFGYRDTLINDDEEVRNIMFLEDIKDTTTFFNEVVVFDRQKGIILFSPYK